ncbi:HAMP domain-containing histidine kinase [Maribacter arcticus]|nr:HAMP domain-containing sensor histidine kinase [Maribacter arcticus]MDA9089841.1 HAMP domain-containing histidine kinase [Maribacter arcticus]
MYSASHELRAPLASVLGLITLILTEENKPGLVASLNMMEKSVKRLDDFIKDIIEYSRNKHLKVNVETINFTNLIESSIESFWYLENMNKIKVKINVDDKIDFASDKKRISILLNNFISNAIKYHDVSKRTPTIWISIKTSKKEAIITIKDNGLGMAEEQLDKIFDMFYRISSQIMGSGIGLFIVKEVLGKLNGTIEVKSALGEGSTFTLKIPNESDK